MPRAMAGFLLVTRHLEEWPITHVTLCLDSSELTPENVRRMVCGVGKPPFVKVITKMVPQASKCFYVYKGTTVVSDYMVL